MSSIDSSNNNGELVEIGIIQRIDEVEDIGMLDRLYSHDAPIALRDTTVDLLIGRDEGTVLPCVCELRT